MSDDWQIFRDDTRVACKYGKNCYQKNPQHHQNFKHPPNNTKRKRNDHGTDTKKLKRDVSPRKVQQDIHLDTDKQDTAKSEANKASTSTVDNNPNSSDRIAIKLPETLKYHDKTDLSLFKELFLVDMPKDFFQFYKCLQDLDSFEKVLSSVNLELIGPYDLLLGKLPVIDDRELYLIHWRFFYDPPEFQAVLKKKGKSEYHIGYFRDDPNMPPEFLASSDSSKGCLITPMADNIFAAVCLYLESEKKSSPFTSMACQKLLDKVKKWAEAHNYSLDAYSMKKRQGKIQTKTLHGAGIVVPFNKKTELGYRKLVETDGNLKKYFTQLESAEDQEEKDKILSKLQPMITYASIAVDECDFGTGLEAGIDLFCSGIPELQASALSILQAVYPLLKRDVFCKILQAHIKYRRKGPDMSILSFK